MAYTCPWPCVSDPVSSAIVQAQAVPPKSFAATLAGKNSNDDSPFPTTCIKGDALSIRIDQDEYQRDVDECKNALKARLTLNKGDKLYSARDLSTKLGKIWKTTVVWKMVPLSKGYYDFHFDLADDLRKIWAAGTINLKSGLLRLSQWTKDFKYYSQKQTHVSLWIRLVELPQEYWWERTLKEIASTVGTPIDIDGPTRNRTFGHYARMLVDIDLSKRAYDEILVERDGFAFKVEVQYERRPLFCHHCYSIGHNVTTCRWLHPHAAKEKNERGKQPVVAEAALPKQTRQHGDVGASTSANGGTWTWVPVPTASTVTTTQRISVPDTTTLATNTQTNLISITSSAMASTTQMVLVTIASTTMATTQTVAPEPSSSLSSNSFSFPLHNVFDHISPDEFPHSSPVFEVVYLEAHNDVHYEKAEQLHQTLREELKNPTANDIIVTLSDDVEHNHSIP